MGQKRVYSKKYKQVQELINNPDFLNLVAKLRSAYSKAGIPIPKIGFNEQGFNKWMIKADKLGLDHAKDLKDLLQKAGLEDLNQEDFEWLENYIFFNKADYHFTQTEYKFTGSGKDKQLWMRIFGHTRLSDISVSEFASMQKQLSDYVGKNKTKNQTNEKRDKEVIRQYQREKIKYTGIGLTQNFEKQKGSLAAIVIKKLKKKYPKLTENTVYKIINKNKNKPAAI